MTSRIPWLLVFQLPRVIQPRAHGTREPRTQAGARCEQGKAVKSLADSSLRQGNVYLKVERVEGLGKGQRPLEGRLDCRTRFPLPGVSTGRRDTVRHRFIGGAAAESCLSLGKPRAQHQQRDRHRPRTDTWMVWTHSDHSKATQAQRHTGHSTKKHTHTHTDKTTGPEHTGKVQILGLLHRQSEGHRGRGPC